MNAQDDYESAAKDAATNVAEFADTRKSPIHRIQHALHVTPSLVPLVVLLASLVMFGIFANNFSRPLR